MSVVNAQTNGIREPPCRDSEESRLMSRSAAWLAAAVLAAWPALVATQGRYQLQRTTVAGPRRGGVAEHHRRRIGHRDAGRHEADHRRNLRRTGLARDVREDPSRAEGDSRAGRVRPRRHVRHERQDQPRRSISRRRRSRISPASASTSSCTARRRRTAICGAGCWFRRTNDEGRSATLRPLLSRRPCRRCRGAAARRRAGLHRSSRPPPAAPPMTRTAPAATSRISAAAMRRRSSPATIS